MKTKARIILAVAACITCLALLAGCAPSTNTDEKTLNRQYMSSVNQIMSDMDASMEEFSAAVKDGEVLSLSGDLETVNKCVDRLKALEAPEALAEINENYVKGAEELQTALSQYVDLYEDVKVPKSGSFDYGTYGKRLSEIQKHYDAGIEALKTADEAVSEA